MKIINTLFYGVAVLLIMQSPVVEAAGSEADLAPVTLRCEYRENPLGIDPAKPRLSWTLEGRSEKSEDRGRKQSAYQILVASTRELLAKDQGDLWDSGKVASDKSNQVEYAGQALVSIQQCFWKVKIWSLTSDLRPPTPSAWSKPAMWTMGLLQPDDWKAKWIGYDAAYHPSPEVAADNRLFNIKGLKWLRFPPNMGKVSVNICFRKQFDLPSDRKVKRAVLALSAYNYCDALINGTAIGHGAHWECTARLDATKALKPGANVVTLTAGHTDPQMPGATGRLVIQFESGDDMIVPTDNTWKASQEPAAGCDKPGFDDSKWPVALEAGSPTGGGPPLADQPRIPAPYLRKGFTVDTPVKRAMVYVTALGTYELRLNGKRVSKDVFAPGWTEFRKRVHYQTYDVTTQVAKGKNAIAAILGDGWYASDLAHLGGRNIYGGRPRFLAQLVIELADGSTQVVVSDANWKASYGPIRHGDIIIGCEYDSRLEMPGWDKAGFDDSKWSPVTASGAEEGEFDVTGIVAAAVKDGHVSLQVKTELFGDPAPNKEKSLRVEYRLGGKEQTTVVGDNGTLELAGADLKIIRARYANTAPVAQTFKVQASVAEPSQVINELPAIKVTEPRPGCWTFDLGQNMVGWVRLKLSGSAGQRITVRHGEMINSDGTIYTAALRSAPATDFFILSGKGVQVLEPYFTFHGFRYVEVRGLTKKPDVSAVTGLVVHTPMKRTGRFDCSFPLVNKLYSNIIWGQKGNYLEVPTDCPQRDERMGWTGDTQFFAPTAAYNFDIATFFSRWLQTCEDNQQPDGSFPNVVPDIMGGGCATAWGDAALLCTYNLYRAYGDTRIVAERFAAMERYMKCIDGKTKDGISKVGGFGDWLGAGGGASSDVIDTAYHAHLARIMAEMAMAIGRDDDAARYAKLHDEVKAAFIKAFLQADGSLKDCSQTGYALAFTMNLLPDDMHEKAAAKFVDEIKRFDWHLATGFIGTPRLLPALSLAGRDDVAYRLLLTDTYPSWLFPVKNGATTMWERWNGWTPDKGFGDINMNSFNHYAFGAVGEYLYGGVGGIKAASPGFKTILIKPAIGEGLTWANTAFDSIYGRITSNWKRDAGKLTMDVTIPINTSATVYVPAKDAAGVTEAGKPAGQAAGVKFLKMDNGAAVFAVESGTYQFNSILP
ncbi:MAG: family 78 glycoside hydrolase catalytic domain [Verrucomicrobiota bacterium]